MTLITLHSRIHFASNILEEALRAEVDDRRVTQAVLLYPQMFEASDLLGRIEEGLQSCGTVWHHKIAPDDNKYFTAEAVLSLEILQPVDLIVAFGSAETMAQARKCRHAITSHRYTGQRRGARDAVRRHELQPDLFVIPGLDGLPDPCLESSQSASFKTTPPSVIVCDPTVIVEAEERDLARAITQSMGRCLSVLTAETFNPLADGLAIDALTRLRRVRKARGTDRRDLMAATINSAIALQKGTGLVEAFGFSFAKSVGRGVDSALLHRVFLARMLASARSSNAKVIGRVLGLPPDMELSDFVSQFLEDFPLPENLREMEIEWGEVEETLDFVEARFGTPQLNSPAEMRQVLQDVF